jgi:glycosyltransferase involved in cell wall biosynthesis
MKIAILGLFPPPFHGVSNVNENMFELLKQRDIEVYRLDYSVAYGRNFLNSAFYLLKSLILFFKHLSWLILHSHSCEFLYMNLSPSLFGSFRDNLVLLFVGNKTKVVGHVHNKSFEANFLETRFLRLYSRLHKIIFLSKSLIGSSNVGCEIEVIPNFINRKYDDFHISTDFASKKNVIRLLFLSNLIRTKGLLDLIAELKNVDRSIKLDIYGGEVGDLTIIELQEFINDVVGQKDNIEINYMGRLDNLNEIIDVYRSADLFCLPSYYPDEAFPLSILEAMSQGTGIVAVENGGIKDILKGVNCLLYNDIKEFRKNFAKDLSKLDGDRLLRMKFESLNKYRSDYSYKKAVSTWSDIFNQSDD